MCQNFFLKGIYVCVYNLVLTHISNLYITIYIYMPTIYYINTAHINVYMIYLYLLYGFKSMCNAIYNTKHLFEILKRILLFLRYSK